MRPFFEEVMINTNGQDVLRYDPSIDDMNVKGDSMDALLQKFSQQRFFPLLECLPSNFTSLDWFGVDFKNRRVKN